MIQNYYCHIESNRNLQNLIAYNTYTNYCANLNFKNKLTFTNHVSNQLVNYIDIKNKDVLTVIKSSYCNVFMNQKPIPFYV